MERRRAATIAGGVVIVVVLAAAIAWTTGRDDGGGETSRAGMAEGDPAAELADRFAAAWSDGTLDGVPYVRGTTGVAEATTAATAGLGLGDARPTVEATSLEQGEDGRATATLRVSWPLDDERTWRYETTVGLVEERPVDGGDARWAVAWRPSVVHPELVPGAALEAERTPAARGELLGVDGEPIVADRPVVLVSFRPGDAPDPVASARQLAEAVDTDADALAARVEAASPGDVLSVITLRAEAFEEVRPWASSIPGVVLQESVLPLAPTRNFARALLGSVGPATAEQVAASAGAVVEGDQVGQSGLHAARDAELRGRPAWTISVRPPGEGAEPVVVEEVPAVDGEDLTITLDPRVQAAADEVLAGAPTPAALVAIRVSTGDVLAVANGPAGADGYNRAFLGAYPPGSVFKVASGLAILADGVTPDTVVPCPATLVAGKEFSNAGGFALGDVPFRTDFARSCNTAFVSQADEVTQEQLAAVGASLGYRELDVGVPAFGGSVPTEGSETEHASAMIGQGKVQASPLAVALASASVAAGRTLTPRLIVDPDAPAAEPGAEIAGAATMRDLMRSVVTEGSGSAVAGVPGGEVFGKTGTAEYGTEDPPATHAWFTGFQGDVAFAVLVEDGSSGGAVAAPIAAQFLTALASA